jgi:hypothetical protein
MNKNKIFGWILFLFPIVSVFSLVLYRLGIKGLFEVIITMIVIVVILFMMFSGLYLISKDKEE